MSHDIPKECTKCLYLGVEVIRFEKEYTCNAPHGIWGQCFKNGAKAIGVQLMQQSDGTIEPPQDIPPEPLIIQILIGAEVMFQEGDADRIDELKKEIIEAVNSNIDKFTGTPYNRDSMYPYLKKADHEVTFSDEGSFEYEVLDKRV